MIVDFAKGHGTGNDFVLIPDFDDKFQLTENLVAALCDRSFGIGADGLIRMVKQNDSWFMDYRNSDGSLAEICGNGTRVMAQYLLENGIVTGPFTLLTRGGPVDVLFNPDKSISVTLGPVVRQELDIRIQNAGQNYASALWRAPNPHLITMVTNLDEIGDLLTQPKVINSDLLPEGSNFEFVVPIDERTVAMRIFERGVGETLSCGSGACAVGKHMQEVWKTEDPIKVIAPGGQLIVQGLTNHMVKLTGPAKIVATGKVDTELIMQK